MWPFRKKQPLTPDEQLARLKQDRASAIARRDALKDCMDSVERYPSRWAEEYMNLRAYVGRLDESIRKQEER